METGPEINQYLPSTIKFLNVEGKLRQKPTYPLQPPFQNVEGKIYIVALVLSIDGLYI